MSFDLRRLDDPVFAGFEHAAAALRALQGEAWPTLERLNEALSHAMTPHGLRLVPDIPKRKKRHSSMSERYDQRISAHGEVPTRAQSWHDFFGALVFATFPRAKRALHARQAALSARQQIPGSTRLLNRSAEADLLTRFDEGGSLVFLPQDAAPPAGWQRRDPVDLRALESVRHHSCVFGHGAFEAHWLGHPLGRSTLFVVPVDARALSDADALPLLDAALADLLQRASHERLLELAYVARFDALAAHAARRRAHST